MKTVRYEYDVVDAITGKVITWGNTRQEARIEKSMVAVYNPSLKTKIIQRKFVLQEAKEVR